jgi:hypothetical protein
MLFSDVIDQNLTDNEKFFANFQFRIDSPYNKIKFLDDKVFNKRELDEINEQIKFSKIYMVEELSDKIYFYEMIYRLLIDTESPFWDIERNIEQPNKFNLMVEFEISLFSKKNKKINRMKMQMKIFRDIYLSDLILFSNVSNLISDYIDDKRLNLKQLKMMKKYLIEHPEKFI